MMYNGLDFSFLFTLTASATAVASDSVTAGDDVALSRWCPKRSF